jgi:GNAT superfamily N-acetyltransferase
LSVSIRVRGSVDLSSCVDVLARVHAVGGYPTNWPADPARWLTPSGLIEAWVASVGDVAVAGHMVITQPHGGEVGHGGLGGHGGRAAVEIGRLFVDPEARRQGVARALMRHATDWATERGTGLTLQVTDHLRAAQALYERTGFQLAETSVAHWTTPDGQPVTVHRYDWHNASASEPADR